MTINFLSDMSKYGNYRYAVGKEVFDSKLEYSRYCQLLILQRGGKISRLERQKRYVLIDKSSYGREIAYVTDFVYEENGKIVIEDTKSMATRTRLYMLKKRLLAERYGIVIKEVFADDL